MEPKYGIYRRSKEKFNLYKAERLLCHYPQANLNTLMKRDDFFEVTRDSSYTKRKKFLIPEELL